MKLTFILPGYSRKPVGGHRIIYEYANRLSARGHEICIVYPKKIKMLWDSYGLVKKLQINIMQTIRSVAKADPEWQKLNSDICRMFVPEPTAQYIPDADVVFSTIWALAEYMLDYPDSKGKQCYFFQHYETWSGPKEIVDATWRMPFKKIVISKWLKNIGESLGATEMHYIPNGLDFSHFRLITSIENRPKRISMMFSDAEWKGGKEGLSALLIAKEKFPELKAILWGVGKRPSEIPKWIEFIQNPGQEDVLVKDIYNNSSIFLCSSHVEGFALPPAEAMACGCAVVTTDCGGVLDFAEHEITALVSAPKNVEALANNLCRLLGSDDLRKQIARVGLNNIKKLSWERSVDLMERFIQA
jgi:L-malate glycosyltransferase